MVNNMKIDDATLTSYLIKHLQPLTEADPNLLAKYVAALLKNNKPKKDLQTLCMDKLFDFLGEESEAFVLSLFHALEDGTIITFHDERDTKVADDATTVPATVAATMLAKVMLGGDNAEPRTTSQSEKFSNANMSVFSDHEEEGTDDEDDDRNHKHRRRVSRSRSLDRDTQDGPLRKRNRPAINGQPMYDSNHLTAEIHRGSNIIYVEKDGPSKRRSIRDHVYGASSRLGGEGNQRGVSRGASNFRGDGIGSRFEHQNGLSRGVFGRGRGATTASWGARDQRTVPLDGSDFNLPMLPPGPSTNLYSRGNPPHTPWAGYGHFSGMKNGTLDPALPLNAGMQGSRGVPKSTALGVGVNIGMVTLGRPRCPDFEERGYCLRGDLCPMEHGANRIVVEDVQSLSKFNLPVALPSARGMALGSVSVSSSSLAPYSSSLGISSIAMRETNIANLAEPSLFKGTLTSAEPDLYDPDQPLWNKEQPAAVADGIRRPTSFRKGPEDNEWESAASERCRGQSADDGRHGRASTASVVPQGLTPGQSVWNRIKRIDRGDIKAESISWPANLSVESLQRLKVPKREQVEDHESQNMSGKWDNNLDERNEKRSRSSNAKGGVNSTPEGEVGHRPTGSSRGGRSMLPGNERAQRTLYVGCIPSNDNRKELLMAHFQKFGEIMDMRIPSQGDRAFVQFSLRKDAEAALMSPEAVMGNRFIRLSWAKRDSIHVSSAEGNTVLPSTGRSMGSGTGGSHGLVSETSLMKGKRQAGPVSTVSESNALKSPGKLVGSNVQPSSSSQKKQEELEHMKEELRRKQEELAQKRDDFRRKLERLSKQSSGVAAELEGDQSSNPLRGASKAEMVGDQPSNKQSNPEKPEAATHDSHKQASFSPATVERGLPLTDQPASGLVKDPLKQPLGLTQTSSGSTAQPSPRGLRGHLPWLGVTGTGFVGSSQWGPLRYKLDNRTTVFRILPPFPDGLPDVATLKEHFSCFGDLSNVEVEDVDQKLEANHTGNYVFRITFCTRSAAEKAFVQGRWYQGTSLHFSWVNPPSSTTAGATSTGSVQAEGINDNPRRYCSGAVEKESEDDRSSKIQRSIAGNGSQVEDGLSMVKVADNDLQPGWAQVPGGGHHPQLETNSKVVAADADSGSGLCMVGTSM